MHVTELSLNLKHTASETWRLCGLFHIKRDSYGFTS